MLSNCCHAKIWQPDPITGHGHCNECGDTCVPWPEEEVREAITAKVREPYEKTGITRDRRRKWLTGNIGLVAVLNLAELAGFTWRVVFEKNNKT